MADTITTGGTTLSRLQFGIGYKSSAKQSILGIGYLLNEVQAGLGKRPYNNLPAQLVAEKKIQTNAYSLWLNDLTADTGHILFGGVDTARYTGKLQTLPIQRRFNYFAEFFITMTELTLAGTVIAGDESLACLLDSGSSLSHLPNRIVSDIYNAVGATFIGAENLAHVPCSLASSTATLDFTFSSVTISVSMRELVIPMAYGFGSDGLPQCLFGITPANSATTVLGDTFLRSAYVVYDMENNEISIAQTNFQSTTSNIVEIGTGSSPVPDSELVLNAVTATTGFGGELVSPMGDINGAGERKPPVVFGAMAAAAAVGMIYSAM